MERRLPSFVAHTADNANGKGTTSISAIFNTWHKHSRKDSFIPAGIPSPAAAGTAIRLAAVPSVKFVVFAQNHDQIGNRMMGERLGQLVSLEAVKWRAAVVLLSPFVPLLFMGDEYGETAPFQYFVSHSDPSLIEAVRKGRAEEFAAFQWKGEPPDPQERSDVFQLETESPSEDGSTPQGIAGFHKELLALRRSVPALIASAKTDGCHQPRRRTYSCGSAMERRQ